MIYEVIVLAAVCFAATSALPPCICTRDYTPVCGSDGETYGNVCMLNCAKATKSDLTVDKMGSCNEQKLCICTLEYKPVCGSDGTTYSNKCVLGCEATVRLAYEGQCHDADIVDETPECSCSRDKKEICGSDGNTYANPCLLNCATAKNPSLSIVNSGPCDNEVKVVEQSDHVKVAETPECACSRDKKEICGSDGNTYANPCLLNCATAKNPSLSIVNSGPCDNEVKVVEQPDHVKVAEIPNCICTREKKEVCGSDGNTYDNPCLLNCAATFHPSLSVASSGPCNNDVKVVEEPAAGPVCACTRDMRPVCGGDGITYGNPCMFNCAAKRNPSLTLARRGPCSSSNHAQCACTRELNPVCGSDGQTYTSICIMKCRNKEAEVVRDGPCDE